MPVEAFQFIGINTWRPESLSQSKTQLLKKFVQGYLLGRVLATRNRTRQPYQSLQLTLE